METGTRSRDGQSAVLLCSFLCGAVTGTAMALLLAPTGGRETRDRLKAKARQRTEQAQQAVERGKAVVDRAASHLKDQARHVSRAFEEGRSALTEMRKRGEQAVGTVRKEVADAVEDAKVASKDIRDGIVAIPPK